ncbi:unnamed protein product, partial [Durusdinium trenchii]
DGQKDFLTLRGDEILRRISGPVTLVFLGFIGKWHAELRLSNKDSSFCGLDSKVPVAMGRPDAPMQVIEEVVFQPHRAPLLLAVQVPCHAPMMDAHPGDMGDVADVDDFQDGTSEFSQSELASMVLDIASSGSCAAQRPGTAGTASHAGDSTSDEGIAGLATPRAAQALAGVYELQGNEAKRLVERVREEAASKSVFSASEPRQGLRSSKPGSIDGGSWQRLDEAKRPKALEGRPRTGKPGMCGAEDLFGSRCERGVQL